MSAQGAPVTFSVIPSNPLQTLRTTLDGSDYLFTFDWNGREGRWYMTIAAIDDTVLAGDIKLICNWPLTRRFQTWLGPPGDLYAIPPASDDSPPLLADLGARVQMVYYPVTIT